MTSWGVSCQKHWTEKKLWKHLNCLTRTRMEISLSKKSQLYLVMISKVKTLTIDNLQTYCHFSSRKIRWTIGWLCSSEPAEYDFSRFFGAYVSEKELGWSSNRFESTSRNRYSVTRIRSQLYINSIKYSHSRKCLLKMTRSSVYRLKVRDLFSSYDIHKNGVIDADEMKGKKRYHTV